VPAQTSPFNKTRGRDIARAQPELRAVIVHDDYAQGATHLAVLVPRGAQSDCDVHDEPLSIGDFTNPKWELTAVHLDGNERAEILGRVTDASKATRSYGLVLSAPSTGEHYEVAINERGHARVLKPEHWETTPPLLSALLRLVNRERALRRQPRAPKVEHSASVRPPRRRGPSKEKPSYGRGRKKLTHADNHWRNAPSSCYCPYSFHRRRH
jgi:hypothetical protein